MEKINLGFGFDTGFGQVDPYTTFGAGSYTGVYADVSMGSEDATTATPTGTGTGVFLDGATAGGFWSLLDKGLNYALLRDQQKMTAIYGPAIAMTPQQQAAVSVQASGDKRLLMYGAIALGVYLLVRSK